MCDPITLGTLAVGAAGTAAKVIGQSSAQNKQKAEFERWQAYQKKAKDAERLRQEQNRGQAQASAEQGLAAVAADTQTKNQAEEAARLEKLYTETPSQEVAEATPTAVSDQMLSGQQSGGEIFQTDLARSLADATASAKKRIGALAQVNAYGGSRGGLGTINPIAQATAGQGIDLANNFRKGSMSAYEAEKAVEPVQVSFSSPIADIASQFLNVGLGRVGANLAGGNLGTVFSDAVKVPSSFGADAWGPLRNVGYTF